MIIIIFFENMVIDAFLACLFNVHYLIFLSMVHEYAYFLSLYSEIGLLFCNLSIRKVLFFCVESCRLLVVLYSDRRSAGSCSDNLQQSGAVGHSGNCEGLCLARFLVDCTAKVLVEWPFGFEAGVLLRWDD